MKKFLISTVSAAVVMAAASIAVAQDKGPGDKGPGAGANAPAARDFGGGQPAGAHADRGGSSMPSAEKAEPKAEGAGRSAEAPGNKLSGDKSAGEKLSNERPAKDGAKDLKDAKGGAAKDDLAKKGSADGAKDGGSAASGASSGESGNATGDMKADSKSSADAKQGGAHVTLNTDQRSRVNSVFKGHKGSASVSVNVDVRVGTRLPRSIALVAIPSDVLVVVPDWQRYRYIVVGNTVCIVDPDTFEIIDVIVLA
jgi:hypothetical protein